MAFHTRMCRGIAVAQAPCATAPPAATAAPVPASSVVWPAVALGPVAVGLIATRRRRRVAL